MLPQIVHNHHNSHTTTVTRALLAPLHKPFVSGYTNGISRLSSSTASLPIFGERVSDGKRSIGSRRNGCLSIKAIFESFDKKPTWVKATITVTPPTVDGDILGKGLDNITDLIGFGGLVLELVAAELDPRNGKEKATIQSFAHRGNFSREAVEYVADFQIPGDFGEVGAIIVKNDHNSEMFIKKIVLDGVQSAPIVFSCESWVAPQFQPNDTRIFFTTRSYLPSETPNGLKNHRKKELEVLRGDGSGERQKFDRIYDYDVYNDLGNPDNSSDLARPILGGNKNYPYPRRCRTGRPKTKKDPLSESKSLTVYVPRDESFSTVKHLQFSVNTVSSVLHTVAPLIEGAIQNRDKGFPFFTAIDSLFNEGINIPNINKSVLDIIPNIIKTAVDARNNILLFDTPELVDRDKFVWMRDGEFSRQTLAGLNPYCIQLVKDWPLKSKLDPEVYGPPESAITEEIIEEHIRGFTTFDEALKQKKLFMLDYHDILLPYVERVRKLKGTTLYGSRTLFFLTPDDTLMPVAIELTRPPVDGKPQWKKVFSPCLTATGTWLWKLARTHVVAHDSVIHQFISHWLRTHCCTEPYIIATRRQLSEMHPIHRLLHPYFRYTMEINALAREALISANGIFESAFSPLKYSMELTSIVYDQMWRFDHQALPADLISRGMAEPDPTAPHGLKLTIEDYPFANDGLIIWDILKKWVTDYVTHYYPDAKSIQSDLELQAWWTEIRTVGHADKKDEPWWPVLNTPDDLIGILTNIMWVTSGHHAAVNFGQYDFAGYFPNRPTIARTTMPTEDQNTEKWEQFLKRPENELLSCFPSQFQATVVMAVLNVLSTHSPDEEYLGGQIEPTWENDPIIKAAFEEFTGRLKKLEGIIDGRNADDTLKNRTGAGLVPYQLLKPFSKPGLTAQGIPNSISI